MANKKTNTTSKATKALMNARKKDARPEEWSPAKKILEHFRASSKYSTKIVSIGNCQFMYVLENAHGTQLEITHKNINTQTGLEETVTTSQFINSPMLENDMMILNVGHYTEKDTHDYVSKYVVAKINNNGKADVIYQDDLVFKPNGYCNEPGFYNNGVLVCSQTANNKSNYDFKLLNKNGECESLNASDLLSDRLAMNIFKQQIQKTTWDAENSNDSRATMDDHHLKSM